MGKYHGNLIESFFKHKTQNQHAHCTVKPVKDRSCRKTSVNLGDDEHHGTLQRFRFNLSSLLRYTEKRQQRFGK